MARPLWLLGTMFALASSGCGLIGFDMTRAIDEQTVPGDVVAHTAASLFTQSPVQPFSFDVNLAGEAAAHGTSVIQRVELKALSFTVTPTAQPAGDTDCFDFITGISLRIESTRNGTTLQPQVIATGGSPGCVQTYPLAPVAGVNLQPYITEGFRITADVQGIPPEDDV